MAESFEYPPLPEGEFIRIFRLDWASATDSISGTLETTSLATVTEQGYHALSYTWNSPFGQVEQELYAATPVSNQRPTILCNQKPLSVTRNLYDALLVLRTRSFKRLWIDAICIDQKSTEEKTAQIRLMGRIYSSAGAVVIWLGPSTPLSEKAIEIEWRIAGKDYREDMPSNMRSFSHVDSDLKWDSLSEDQVQHLEVFASRQWFRRVWTLQEFAMNRSNYAFCGDRIFHPRHFLRIVSVATHLSTLGTLRDGGWPKFTLGRKQGDSSSFGSAAMMFTWVKMGPFRQDEPDTWHTRRLNMAEKTLGPQKRWATALEMLVFDMRHRAAKESKDRIIAPLSLAKEAAHNVSVSHLMDYKADDKALCRDFTVFMVEALQDLDIISHVGEAKSNQHLGLPSWAPNFYGPPIHTFIQTTSYHACSKLGNLDIALALSRSSEGCLTLRAVKIDQIESIIPIILKGEPLTELIRTAALIKDRKFHKESSFPDILGRTLVANIISEPGVGRGRELEPMRFFRMFLLAHIGNLLAKRLGLSADHQTALQDFWKDDLSLHELVSSPGVWPLQPDGNEYPFRMPENLIYRHATEPHLHTQDSQDADIFSAAATRHGKHLFISNTGYLGLAPKSAGSGDTVWIFQGGKIPFMLRKKETGNYNIVGEAYVHGFMDGSVADLGLPLQTIVLE